MSDSRKLYLAEFAAMAGVREGTLSGYRARGTPPMPEPDGQDLERGHVRPWWWEATVREWMASRSGSGRWGKSRERHARDAR